MSNVLQEIKEGFEELRSTWAEYQSKDAEREAEIKQLGEATAETTEAIARIDAKLDEKVDELNVQMQKAKLDSDRPADGEPSPAAQAWLKAVRLGANKLTDEERQLLTYTDGSGNMLEPRTSMVVADDTEGGFLAPDEIVSEIIKGVVEFSPMRTICRVRTTSRNSVKAPKRTQTAGAVWVGEADTRSETQNPKYGKEELGTRELHALADISRQDLEDTAFNLEDEIYGEFGEQFGVSEGTAFVSGDGVDGKPEGFLTAADTGYLGANGIETITSVSNDALHGDDFINLFYGLKDAYARNGTWVLRRATVAAARKLKDAVDGQYIWQPGLATLAPATILGRPYVEAPDMPAVANGALAVAFGDWRRGYWIIDRIQIETLRDPYTQGPGFVRFWARKRVGGQTVLPEALKLLEIQ